MSKLKTVLFVEDDIPTNFLNKRVMDKAQCTENIELAANGVEAIDIIKNKISNNEPLPELIFLDINMPKMNGWEFIEEYKELTGEEESSTVIFMITTSLNEDDRQRAEDMIPIPTGFMNKPLDLNKINEILEAHFPDCL